jgi:hypothetical protein
LTFNDYFDGRALKTIVAFFAPKTIWKNDFKMILKRENTKEKLQFEFMK